MSHCSAPSYGPWGLTWIDMGPCQSMDTTAWVVVGVLGVLVLAVVYSFVRLFIEMTK